MLELEVRAHSQRRFRFGPDRTVTIGRDSECVLPLDDTSASRIHCVVTYRSGHWLLRDADSRNGTTVNLEEVHSRALQDGDVIRVGRTEIGVHITLAPPSVIQPAIADASNPGLPPESDTGSGTGLSSVTNDPRMESPSPAETASMSSAIAFGPVARRTESLPTGASAPVGAQTPIDSLARLAPPLPVDPDAPVSPLPAAPPMASPAPAYGVTVEPGTDEPTPDVRPVTLPLRVRVTLPLFRPVQALPTGETDLATVSAESGRTRVGRITGGANVRTGAINTAAAFFAPSPAPAAPADSAPRRRAHAPAWLLSLGAHAAILFLLSGIIVSYQYIKTPATFVVGLSAHDADLGRKALQSRRPEPVADSPEDAHETDLRENLPTATSSKWLGRPAHVATTPTWERPGPMHASSGFRSDGLASARNQRDFRAEIGDPGRREAIENALRWLAEHQSPEGGWSTAGFADSCGDPACIGPGKAIHDPGITGLAVLAFLGAGYTQGDGPYGAEIRAALMRLAAGQAPDGALAPPRGKFMYSHAIATAALCQAYAQKRTPALRAPAERATHYLLAAQTLRGGWRYKPAETESDTSVTGWAVLALVRARMAGFEIPAPAFARVLGFLQTVTDPSGHVGYQSPLDLGSRPEDGLDKFPPREATTAIGTVCRLLCSADPAPTAPAGSIALIVGQRPSWGADGEEADMIGWFFGSLALARVTHKEKATWQSDLARVALERQVSVGCAQGSWPPLGPWGGSGGRVYATAITALALQAEGGGILAGLPGAGRPMRPSPRK